MTTQNKIRERIIEVLKNMVKNNKVEYCDSQEEYEKEQEALFFAIKIIEEEKNKIRIEVDIEKLIRIIDEYLGDSYKAGYLGQVIKLHISQWAKINER